MNPFQLLNPSYLFDKTPGSSYAYFWLVLVLLIALFVGSFYISRWIKAHEQGKLMNKYLGGIPYRMREVAVLGLVLNVFRAENIPWLGMRFWMVLLGASFLVYLVAVWRNYEKSFDTSKEEKAVQSVKAKYLPKKKKKSQSKRRK